MLRTLPAESDSVVNVPAAALLPPIVTPFTVPPEIVTLLAFWVDIVPRPLTDVLAIEILVFPAAVSRPCASTVNVATCVAEP